MTKMKKKKKTSKKAKKKENFLPFLKRTLLYKRWSHAKKV